MKSFSKIKYLIHSLLLITCIFTGCKGIAWGTNLEKLKDSVCTTYTFYADAEKTNCIKIKYVIGETYTIPTLNNELLTELGKEGYQCKGWDLLDAEIPETFILDDEGNITGYQVSSKEYSFVAKGWEGAVVNYTVIEEIENIDDDNYSQNSVKTYSGKAGTLTDISAETKEGFEEPEFTNEIIKGDGSTVIEVKYRRKLITVKILTDVNTEIASVIAKYGSKIDYSTIDLSKPGYKISGYKVIASLADYDVAEIVETPPAAVLPYNFHVVAVYEPSDSTVYTVQYYYENIEDDDYTLESTESLTGTTCQLTNITPATKEGFEEPEFTNETIKADGSTVIEVRYKRKVYTLTFDFTLWDHIDGTVNGSKENYVVSGKYEATVPAIPDVDIILSVANPYKFTGWGIFGHATPDELPVKFTADETYYACFEDISTTYKIEYYFENTDGNDFVRDDSTVTINSYEGEVITETDIQAYIITKPHFTYHSYDINEEVKKDGTTRVNLYYMRDTYTVTVNLDGGTTATTLTEGKLSVKYGAAVQIAAPVKTGYTFQGWKNQDNVTVTLTELIIEDNDTVLTAYYEPNQKTVEGITVTFPEVSSTIPTEEKALQRTSTDQAITFSIPVSGDPSSYTYVWTINGTDVSNDSSYEVKYEDLESGYYEVICIATDTEGNLIVAVQTFEVKHTLDISDGGNY